MTKNEFIEKIESGSDIMFDVSDRHFTIVTWLDEGIGIGEQYKNEPLKVYDTVEDLISKFKVDNKALEELCDKIVITQYS
jgi:hypothetical protein